MKTFGHFNYENKAFNLSHLNAFEHTFIQEAKKNKPEKRYRCIFEFSHHCFTKSPNSYKNETLENYSSDLFYNTEKEVRIFSEERYQLSLMLPEIMKKIHHKKCFFTSANDKFLTISITDKNGEKVDYEIYFSLRRSKKYDVHIFINSAYIRSDEYKPYHQPLRRKPISFFVLLHNTLHNKKIKRPK